MFWRRDTVTKPKITGNCTVIEHTGDGHSVGRCECALYDGVCPRHGRTPHERYDDRELPAHELRDWGPPEVREYLIWAGEDRPALGLDKKTVKKIRKRKLAGS